MNVLQKTLAIVAFLFLATQAVRNAYLLWLVPPPSVLDQNGLAATKNQIAKATSLEEIAIRYDAVHKEADAKRLEEKKAGVPLDSDREPFKSESELRGAITEWESRAEELRELRFHWFVGLGFLVTGVLVYAKWNQWLGLTLSIIAFGEFIFWTFAESFSFVRTLQTRRLHANKLAFTIASMVLLLVVIQLQGIFKNKVEAQAEHGLA